MVYLVYLFVILLIFYVTGAVVLKGLGALLKTDWTDKVIIAPVAGAAFMMCISQLLALILPASVIAKVWWILFFILSLWKGKDIFTALYGFVKKHWMFLLGCLAAFCIVAWPMVRSGQLLSLQYANNDIIYYLSTMDWLKDHTLLETVQYGEASPYFLCAQYILSTTRFGSDVLGSVMMQMTYLEAYQIFSFLGVIYVVLTGFSVYYFVCNVLKIREGYGTVISFAALACFSWKELLIMQYVPQMLGICTLTMFVFLLIDFFVSDDGLSKVLTSLFLVATASTYAEFASYMLIIYVGIVVIQMIYTKQWGKTIKDAILIGVTAIIFNPLGFYIAVKFNLKTLENVGSIDAFNGNIRRLLDVVAGLIGGPVTAVFGGSSLLLNGYKLLLAGGSVCFLGFLIYLLIKKRTKLLAFITWILLFFAGYEVYFHATRLAYGEYKHIFSISVMMVVILLYFVYEVDEGRKYKICFTVTALVLLALNAKNYRISYPDNVVIKYDDTLEEVSEGLELVPKYEKTGILGNAHYIQHQLVYAARNSKVQLMGEGVNSYFSMLGIPLNNELPDYILCLKDSEELETVTGGAYETLWQNERFMIVKCH